MEPLTRADRKTLRHLAGLAYERELSRELDRLHGVFTEWKAGRCDAFQLSDAIHRFHQGPSRALYLFYGDIEPEHAVARAIARGLLHADEVPDTLQTMLAETIDYYARDVHTSDVHAREASDG